MAPNLLLGDLMLRSQERTRRSSGIAAWAITLLSTGLLSAYALSYPLNHDVGWWLYIARSMLHGERLYVDLIEINPPLYGYLALVPVRIAEFAHIGAPRVAKLLVLGVCVGSAVTTSWLINRRSLRGIGFPLMVILFAAVLVGLPGRNWGQREHLMVASALPYLVISAQRVVGMRQSTRVATVIGVVAGLGFALKPHFVGVWLALEASHLLRCKSPARWWSRPETRGVAFVVIAYAVAVVVLVPNYLSLLWNSRHLYGAFSTEQILELVRTPTTLLLAVAIPTYFGLGSRSGFLAAFCREALVFGFVAWGMAVIQGKGWPYHFLPALAMLSLATILIALEYVRTASLERAVALGPAAATCLIAVLFLALQLSVRDSYLVGNYRQELLTSRKDRLAASKAKSFVMLSHRVSDGFPLVNYTSLRWASPYPTLWWIQAAHRDYGAIRDAIRPSPRDSVEESFRDRFVLAFRTERPGLVLVDTVPSPRFEGAAFPYLEYLSGDSTFDRAWSRYVRCGSIGGFAVYRLDECDIKGHAP